MEPLQYAFGCWWTVVAGKRGRTLAVVEDVEPTELDLLYESIDPEALDAIFDTPVIDNKPPTRIEFGVSDYLVVVNSNGQITLLETDR